jgi:hypothetical protein
MRLAREADVVVVGNFCPAPWSVSVGRACRIRLASPRLGEHCELIRAEGWNAFATLGKMDA